MCKITLTTVRWLDVLGVQSSSGRFCGVVWEESSASERWWWSLEGRGQPHNPILGQDVGVVPGCKYLGIHINNRLNWKTNKEAIYKRGWWGSVFFQCPQQIVRDISLYWQVQCTLVWPAEGVASEVVMPPPPSEVVMPPLMVASRLNKMQTE